MFFSKKSPASCQTAEYQHPKTCIMILDVLHTLLKRAMKLRVVIVGADLVFTLGKTHFYKEQGDVSPLRAGKSWLKSELLYVYTMYKKAGSELYVAGPTRDSLLPFPWYNEHIGWTRVVS